MAAHMKTIGKLITRIFTFWQEREVENLKYKVDWRQPQGRDRLIRPWEDISKRR